MERESWGGKMGFWLAAAGSAIGLGNIWRFPYLTGANGGAAFVFIYLLIVLTIGFSVMLAEFAIGRHTNLNAVGAFQKLKGGPWQIAGWMGVLAGFVILSFYSVIGGWTIKYILSSFTGMISTSTNSTDYFLNFIANGPQTVLYHAIFMAITIFVVYRGVGKGIEDTCKILMPALFAILVILIIRAVTLPGALAGIDFYLNPDFSKITGKTILAALGQAFFSLSLGMGCMITYGSYIKSKKDSLPKAAAIITLLDTSAAFLAGFVIFPTVFAFGAEPGAGPGLTFITLPKVFALMPGGQVWSALFFLLLCVAALTSAISLLEVVVAYAIDNLKWPRHKAAIGIGGVIFLLGVPSALSQGAVSLNILGMSFLDLLDFISNNILLTVGGLLISLFVGWVIPDIAKKETTSHGPFAFQTIWLWICRVVAPVAIFIIILGGFGLF
ncbi:MAG: Sodium:neurotransmitter symporter family protein [Candidatus Methanofastidiosum methylothiophilum]|jgi:NSS family neurotransmitter:Na+ symporter|uniref:Transporter n=1 Tax=Candidatus Methanofastidiosum methylothiophilum TaxID=1705564 RepID=A0A150JAM2_9EURY|nr:MAG: Sodium:neurotransmitter symporter family protein [Candidatus Methanofastidiosum methylthiophilus]MBP6932172.1 sodium-dependent transporter [Methanofastidiosum sp.]OQC52325.1 MAG: Sodium:neurotransmitter symporter family protein [Euryarchaeota archaeon ADurb.Bin023]KYC56723.1 MAG: Sodium:neurotransmitter symporter family protein [Candidatus Methanofastidiosum methylthiophilus]KYC57815.1 MAG: Sodium:neurotransmitter symporter family protein [Candidatus Methanofastidiosum methylthiophilus]